ncbi:MAG TPA: hypothetical protein VJS30_31595 [Paraburkholderia sp.]|nr:hypothetical protein [Paraburkholderia sp.]
MTGRLDVPDTGRRVAMSSCILPEGSADMLNQCIEHNGYCLRARANPASRDLYAADLVIERPGSPSRHFHALDHFYDAGQALRYATRWGRIWVDHQVRKIAGKTLRFVIRDPANPAAALLYWLGMREPSQDASFVEVTRRYGPLMQVVFADERPGAFVNRKAVREVVESGAIDRLVFSDDSWLDVWSDSCCSDLCNLHACRRHTCR